MLARTAGTLAAMRALILAAGRGTRLGRLGANKPKALLDVGGRPLIGWMIDRLRRSGASEIVVVTGHRTEMIDDALVDVPKVRTVFNPEFARAGSMASLAVGVAALAPADDESIVVTHADVLCEQRGIRRVRDAAPGEIMLLSGLDDRGDEVLAAGRPDTPTSGTLTAMSKDPRQITAPVGEVVGLSRFSGALLSDCVTRCALHRECNYEQSVISGDMSVGYELMRDLTWGEVDDEAQLARVRTEIAPRAAAADQEEAR